MVTRRISGFIGGNSGVWAPTVVMYLLGRRLKQSEMVRVQSLCQPAGALMLLAGPVLAWLVIPAMVVTLPG